MQCDRYAEGHMFKCDNEEELVQLFRRYSERIDLRGMDFSIQPGDFEQLAKNTWNDTLFQKARTLKKAS